MRTSSARLCMWSALSNVTEQESLQVIDGQQRSTTCTLLIAALARYFETKGLGERLETFSAKKLFNYYLLNPEEEGERHFKLILSETDKETLLALLKNTPCPQSTATGLQKTIPCSSNGSHNTTPSWTPYAKDWPSW